LDCLPFKVGDKNYNHLSKQHRYNLEDTKRIIREKVDSGKLSILDDLKLNRTVDLIDKIIQDADGQSLNNGWHNRYDFSGREYPVDSSFDKRTRAVFEGEYNDSRYGSPALIQLYLNKIPVSLEKYKNWLEYVKIPHIRNALLEQLERERPNGGAQYRAQMEETLDVLNKAIEKMPSLEERVYNAYVKEEIIKNGSNVKLYDENGRKLTPKDENMEYTRPPSPVTPLTPLMLCGSMYPQLMEGEATGDGALGSFDSDGWVNSVW